MSFEGFRVAIEPGDSPISVVVHTQGEDKTVFKGSINNEIQLVYNSPNCSPYLTSKDQLDCLNSYAVFAQYPCSLGSSY